MTIGFVQPGTRRGMFLQMMASRNTVPPSMFLIVPLGDFHIFFSLNSTQFQDMTLVSHLKGCLLEILLQAIMCNYL